MTAPAALGNDLILEVRHEIRVEASLEDTFAALLEELGTTKPIGDDRALPPLTLEAWPGGRWYRDLGNGAGHFWAHVQAIKAPTLLELTGPLFMSNAVANNVQYRLAADGDATVVTFRHSALGLVPEEHRAGVASGWTTTLERVRRAAEGRVS